MGSLVDRVRSPTAEESRAKLKGKRVVDAQVADSLCGLGWTQSGPLEGLLWCSVCAQPTIWKDHNGRPMHLLCSEFGQE